MKQLIKKLLTESLNDYKGGHEAPDKSNIPIYDMTLEYPDDIYSKDAVRLYGDNSDEYSDYYTISIIHNVRNKPNAMVKIYRAIPDINHDINKQIKKLTDLTSYKNKWGFFPIKDETIYDIDDKLIGEYPDYQERQKQILNFLYNEINDLEQKKENKIKINDGDWVTINPDYAKLHGKNNLKKYKILTKTVSAKTLYTYGDNIHEWGYNI